MLPRTYHGWVSTRRAVNKLLRQTLRRELKDRRPQGIGSVRIEGGVESSCGWDAGKVAAVEFAIGAVAEALLAKDVVACTSVPVSAIIAGIKETLSRCKDEGIGKRQGRNPSSLNEPLNGREKDAVRMLRQACGYGFGGGRGRPFHRDPASGLLVMPTCLRGLFPAAYRRLKDAAKAKVIEMRGEEEEEEVEEEEEEEDEGEEGEEDFGEEEDGAELMERLLTSQGGYTAEFLAGDEEEWGEGDGGSDEGGGGGSSSSSSARGKEGGGQGSAGAPRGGNKGGITITYT